MSGHISIVRATESDLPSLVTLRYRWRVDEEGEAGGTIENFESGFLAWYADHRNTHLGYLAFVDEVPIGCAWLFVVDRIPGPGRFVRRSGMLQSVYVAPELRSAGIGAQLVEFVINEAKAMELDYLMVHPSPKSFDFYRGLGFIESGKVLELRFT